MRISVSAFPVERDLFAVLMLQSHAARDHRRLWDKIMFPLDPEELHFTLQMADMKMEKGVRGITGRLILLYFVRRTGGACDWRKLYGLIEVVCHQMKRE